MKKYQPDAFFVRGHLLLSIKHCERATNRWRFKARFVALGDDVRNIYGEEITEEDLYTS